MNLPSLTENLLSGYRVRMAKNNQDKRNFLFFLNEIHPLSIEDSLIGALASPSSWDAVTEMVNTARQKDAFVRSINRVQLYNVEQGKILERDMP